MATAYSTFSGLPAATTPLNPNTVLGGDDGIGGTTVRFTAQDIADLAGGGGGGGSGGPVVQGRLTTESGVPVSTSDRTAQSTLYFTPYKGNTIALWDGLAWTATTFTETSIVLSGLVAHTNYDVFGYLNSGVLALEIEPWKNAIVTFSNSGGLLATLSGHGMGDYDPISFTNTGGSLPTGLSVGTLYWVRYVNNNTFNIATTQGGTAIAYTNSGTGTSRVYGSIQRQTAVTIQDGRYCKSGDKTRLYLGTFRTTSSTTTEDSRGGTVSQVGGKRFVWNYYNRVSRPMRVLDTTSAWSYAVAQVRQANGAVGNKVEMVTGISEDGVNANLVAAAYLASNTARTARVGIGYTDTTSFATSPLIGLGYNVTTTAGWYPMGVSYSEVAGTGYSSLVWLESGADGTCAFAGTNSGASMAGLVAITTS